MRWFLIGLIALILTGFFVIRSDFFTIKLVDVQVDKVACTNADQIKNTTNIIGSNIIWLNTSKVKDSIRSKFLCVKDVLISAKFPNKVNIFASGREPKAIILVAKAKEATESANIENIATPSARIHEEIPNFLVDDERMVFAQEASLLDIPRIYYHEDLSLGQVAPSSISDALKILEKVKSYGLDIKESETLDELFLIYPNLGVPRVAFRLGENLDIQLASLQLILNQAKIDENQLEFIDLRFDKPVVKLAPKKK